MLYRKIPKTGDELSILGFGCMRLPEKGRKIDEKRASKQIHYAIDHGVNYIDTAMPYHMGASEPFLGLVLANGYRDKVKLATKLLPMYVKTHMDMDRLLNSQLDRLNTDHIDYYLLHGLDGRSWEMIKQYDVFKFLDDARKKGKVINLGFSFHGDKDIFKEIVDAYDWEVCQIQYNYLDEQNQAGKEGLEYAAAKRLGVIIMEPLRGGNLTLNVPQSIKDIWDEANIKRTPAEWAFRWVWDHPEVTTVLSGMNDEMHIDENIRIANEAYPNSLNDEELNLINTVKNRYRDLMSVGCTGCRYCMPCPEGVNIPMCFEIYNNMNVFGNRGMSRLMYLAWLGDVMTEEPSYASLCKDCGKCEKVCPQHLPIPELLKDVVVDLEVWWMKPVVRIARHVMGIQRWRSLRRARRLERQNK
ncbi:MAG: aldo/keto reductase [Spirochaetota bacterium]|nr:aldo/keto reductase [Spirochaetota bacterium]